MRWTSFFSPTLRDAPADAEAISHQLLVRGGFIRQLHSGHYTLLPLAFRVRKKIIQIVEDEMDAIGGQEVQMPTLQPSSIWKESGRWESMGEIMFRLEDRHGSEAALGVTAEEIFATVANEISSYKQLPQMWYQIHTKYRDEARPKSGLLRVREFTMKDAYSFDVDESGLDEAFEKQHQAYIKIFERLDLDVVPVEASSGNMGGSDSIEFMVRAESGEDDVLICGKCGYAANIEKAVSELSDIVDESGPEVVEKFSTPEIRTIAALAEIGYPSETQIKTMVYMIDGQVTLVLVRGDHMINEQKLADATQAVNLRPASKNETMENLGAFPGSLGAVGVADLPVLADHALNGRTNMTTGANEDDYHLSGVNIERDINVSEWLDLREVQAGEACVSCGGELDLVSTIESGHIFKLGSKYAEVFGAKVLDENGVNKPLVMGSYGIGIERAMATIVETHHDDKGIVWPVSVAPFHVVITVVQVKDDESMRIAEEIYGSLTGTGIEVLLDDRDARPGVKFADAELIGVPVRVTIGPKGIADGVVEVTPRKDGETNLVAIDDVVAHVTDLVR
ncbi:MAG: proline--tRNA ligase [Acidimicrobiales bacterium]|mgnify:CR=1 FL=1|jgi:prolyl-tRNA synthetase|nr:proline--tRNA ligase [Acidimicrobiales bacterium]HJM28917.1 proline--tRNA ligase [Acidimicrobiales bacterium]